MIGAIILMAALLLPAGPASADLGLVGTSPAEGATVTEPVTEVRLTFSAPGEPAGAGIVLLDQAGQPVPTAVSTPDGGVTWVATPETPLGSGQYGVDWRVAALDSHAATGSFRFTVALPVVEEPAPVADPAEDSAAVDGRQLGDEPVVEPIDEPAPDTEAEAGGSATALDEVLGQPRDTTTAQAVRWAGTAVMLGSALLGVGGMIFLAFAMAGRRAEVRAAFRVIRWSAATLIAGTALQVAGRSTMRQDGDWAAGLSPSAVGDLLGSGSYGLAIGLRLVGAVLILVGLRTAYADAPKAALGDGIPDQEDPVVAASLKRSLIAVLGAVLVVVSFLFDGHTVTAEPRALLWLSDIVHVVAAATWVGGIAMLAMVLWRRHRARQPWGASYLAVRFSVSAGAAVALAGLAGVALTVGVIDEPNQLWTTTWGQVLIAKVVLVTIVAGIGAYNHFRLIPVLEEAVDLRTGRVPAADGSGSTGSGTAPATGTADGAAVHGRAVTTRTRQHVEAKSDRVSRQLRMTVTAEVAVLLGVVALTGFLVNASAVG